MFDNDSAYPNLLWLTQGRSAALPSLRLRVLEIMPHLEDTFEQSHCPAPTSLLGVWRLRHRLRQADIVVLQKELVSIPVIRLIRQFSQRLVYDFDDAVYVRLLATGDCRFSHKRTRRFTTICKAVDLTIAGNPILENAGQQHGARKTIVLPTSVALPSSILVNNKTKRPIKLGWIGTNVNLPYIESIENIFLNLKKEGLSFQLNVMAGKAPSFQQFTSVKFFPWNAEAEKIFLARIDIGLMPLANNEHTRGKCAYKALQYMSYGKPVIVSDVGINAQWTANAGFTVTSEQDLADCLRRLITNSELRRNMGSNGRERIKQEFERSIVATRLRKTLLSLIQLSGPE